MALLCRHPGVHHVANEIKYFRVCHSYFLRECPPTSQSFSAFKFSSQNKSSFYRPNSFIKTPRTFQIRYYNDLPSHFKINLPALSPTMESGTVVSWQKKEGDQLSEGDLLCEIETDKATMGFETPEEGYLAKIIIPEGSRDVPIGKLLCIIVSQPEDVVAFRDFTPGEESVEPASPFTPLPSTPPSQSAPSPPEPGPLRNQQIRFSSPKQDKGHMAAAQHRIKASPYAKKIASEQAIDLTKITGSGPYGRILSSDVVSGTAAAKSPQHEVLTPPAALSSFVDIPLSNMRKTIAKRLTESKSTIPNYYLTAEIQIDGLMELRQQLNSMLEQESLSADPTSSGPTPNESQENGKKKMKLSVNDFMVKASALACLRIPAANSFFMDTFIRQNNNVDVSVAVSTDVGLITPIIFNAHTKGLATINGEMIRLANRAREGKLQPHEFQGGTFTVSNLGMYGSIDHFTAIINPPQSCILAVGAARRKLIPADNEKGFRHVTTLCVTLSCDHRVVDGAVGAVWLQHFRRFIEHPYTMLL